MRSGMLWEAGSRVPAPIKLAAPPGTPDVPGSSVLSSRPFLTVEVGPHRVLPFVNGFATSRTLSMKRRAVEPRVRFFKVTIPTGAN